MGARSPLDRIALAGLPHRRPGSPARPAPTSADIAAALRSGPVHLTQGEADELAVELVHLWGRP